MLKSLPPGTVKLGVMRQEEKEEPSLADDIMNEIKSKNGEVDKSNQSFKASREFAEQIAPIIQTPRQLVSVVPSSFLELIITGVNRCNNTTNQTNHSSFVLIYSKRYVP